MGGSAIPQHFYAFNSGGGNGIQVGAGIAAAPGAKEIDEGLRALIPDKDKDKTPKLDLRKIPKDEYKSLIKDLTGQMELASANLEFEKAAELRDQIAEIKEKL